MKKFAFLFFFGFSLSASAQYLGGSGDGDIKTGISSKLLNGSAGTSAWYFGGSGDGDVRTRGSSILLNGTAATTNWFYGGSGDGDVKSTRLTSSYLGEIEWVGSTSTDWNTTGNWRQTILPVDGRVKISSSALRDLNLDQNRTINTLDFNGSGKKVCPGNFNLTVNTGFVGANSTNYVKTTGTGTVKTSIANGGTFAFPVGNTDYNPVTINNNTGSSDNFDVRVLDEVYNRGSSGTALTDPRVSATWLINKTSGTSNAGNGVDLAFVFDATQKKSGLSNDNGIRLYHYGSSWTKQSAAGSISKVVNTYTYTYSQYKGSFSPFSLGDDIVILPVNWLAFSCKRLQLNQAQVSWTVSDESQVASYTIGRSLDGVRYDSIGNVTAVGNVAGIQRYEFLDKNTPLSTVYYRIGQRDISGTVNHSNPCVSVIPSAMQVADIEVYPNPANQQLMLTAMAPERSFNYVLSDVAGKNILKGNSHEGKAQVETGHIPPGVYYINIVGSGIHLNRKVLINH